MKALGKLKKQKGLWLYDAPMPEIGPDEVLVKIKKTAICGTDLHIYKWDEWAQATIPVPMTVGHEFMGVIDRVGKNVKTLKSGDRVSGEGHLICNACRNCREGNRHHCNHTLGIGVNRTGCFAEFLAMPAENIIPIPNEIPDEVGAFLDPLGNAIHTTLAFDIVGEDVLITGAGPIGMMACAIAKFAGAHRIVITDVNDGRLSMAKKMGATRTVNVSKENLPDVMTELKMKEGFGVGLEMSGNANAFNTMIDCMNHGGKIAVLGILPSGAGVDWIDVIFKSLTIKGIYGRQMYATWHKMIAMLQTGLDVRPVITHLFRAEEFEKGFEAMEKGASGKVVLSWAD
jgi:threonine 3-dehydrogenase